ncbi:MAG: ABC transporter permease subunit [Clostridiales bacterium]|nr:ABC transporter permease subunit [Clostridiales bacterium]
MKPSTTSLRKKSLYTLFAVVFWLIIWQLASMFIAQEILLVSPVAVIEKLFFLVRENSFWQAISLSLGHISLGFLLGLLFGCLLAVCSSFSPFIRQLLSPLMMTIKSVPVASFVILALFWFSSYHLSIFISFLMVFPVIYANVLTGFLETDVKLLEMASVFQVSFGKKIRYIYLSQVLPFFRTGCSLALGLCWKAGIAAEVIGIPKGFIGEKLYEAKIYLETADLLAWTVVIVFLSLLFEKIVLWFVDGLVRRLEGRHFFGYKNR